MTRFLVPLDIMNRALQHLGQRPIAAVGEDSVSWLELNASYDKLRRAELQRNNWRFSIKKAVLYPVTNSMMLLVPPTWASGTTYSRGMVVQDSNAQWWVSLLNNNIGNNPTTNPVVGWETYFGSRTVDIWNQGNTTTTKTAYNFGDLVYGLNATTGAVTVYQSIANNNQDVPGVGGTVTAWVTSSLYTLGQVVSYGGVNYQSLYAVNTGLEPDTNPLAWTTTVTNPLTSLQWQVLTGATLSPMQFLYPFGAGPTEEEDTRNVFMLPYGYLRQAPQDPKAGSTNYMGTPSGQMYDDWEFDNDHFISMTVEPIVFRFAADVVQVGVMDDMFCEGLAARLGWENCERITQSSDKLKTCMGIYKQSMTEARLINGIEEGPTEPPVDDYIACRV